MVRKVAEKVSVSSWLDGRSTGKLLRCSGAPSSSDKLTDTSTVDLGDRTDGGSLVLLFKGGKTADRAVSFAREEGGLQ